MAHHALHQTDLSQSLTHLYACLAPGGFLIVNELLGSFATGVYSAIGNANLKGKSAEEWQLALAQSGFAQVKALRSVDSLFFYVIFSRAAEGVNTTRGRCKCGNELSMCMYDGVL